MTVNWLIYALGGGHGHGIRGAILQKELSQLSIQSTLIVTPTAAQRLPVVHTKHTTLLTAPSLDPIANAITTRKFSHLAVDTFPRGWNDEIASYLKYFSQRILIRRYCRKSTDCAMYDHIWSPYSQATNEWHTDNTLGQHTGLWLRPDPIVLKDDDSADLAIIDPEQRSQTKFKHFIQKLRVQYRVRYAQFHNKHICARRYLFIGAGYHTFFETLQNPVDVRFVALPRRYDNQSHRVNRWQRGIANPAQLHAWLNSPPVARPVPCAPTRLAHFIREVL